MKYYILLIVCIFCSFIAVAQSAKDVEIPPGIAVSTISNYSRMYSFKGSIWLPTGLRSDYAVRKGNGVAEVTPAGKITLYTPDSANSVAAEFREMALYRDTIFAVTEKGLVYLKGKSFVAYSGAPAKTGRTYSLDVAADEMVMGTDSGMYYYRAGAFKSLRGAGGYNGACYITRITSTHFIIGDGKNLRVIRRSDGASYTRLHTLNTITCTRVMKIGNLVLAGDRINRDGEMCVITDTGLIKIHEYYGRCEMPIPIGSQYAQCSNGSHLTFAIPLQSGPVYHIIDFTTQKPVYWAKTGRSTPPNLAIKTADGFAFLSNISNKTILTFCTDKDMEKWNNPLDKKPGVLQAGKVSFFVGPDNDNISNTYSTFNIKNENCYNTVFARSLWITAMDSAGRHLSAIHTYGQIGSDFSAGPLRSDSVTDSALMAAFRKVAYINLETIQAHQQKFALSGFVATPHPDIVNWPAYWVDGKDTEQLAPWHDQNKNGIYDPQNGDYPIIKGSEATFAVFNDGGIHTESSGPAMGIQIAALFYDYHCPASSADSLNELLDHTIFAEYTLKNKWKLKLTRMSVAEWQDNDIGNYADDRIRCAPTQNVAVAYNGDDNDEGFMGAGKRPGAQCIKFLEGPAAIAGDSIDNDNDGIVDEKDETCLLTYFQTYFNDNDPVRGNPFEPKDYYNYTHGKWLNGVDLSFGKTGYGGTSKTRFMFPGTWDPEHTGQNWTSETADLIPGDIRMMSTSSGFGLNPGGTAKLSFAYYYVRDKSRDDQMPEVLKRAAQLQQVYNQNLVAECWLLNTPVQTRSQIGAMRVAPNPGNGIFNIEVSANCKAVEVWSLQGQLLHTINLTDGRIRLNLEKEASGIYLLRSTDGLNIYQTKIIKL